MSTETEQLVVSLEARIRDFERNFAKAQRTSGASFDKIEARAKQSGDRLEKTMGASTAKIVDLFKTFGGGMAGGIIGGLSVTSLSAIVSQVNQVAEGVAMIGSNAKRAGVGVKAFQELSYIAKQNRIDVDALTDGLKELNLRADEFVVTGKGSAAEAFQRLGYSASQLKEKLKDPSALLVEIMGRMEDLSKAAQIRIADELFGGTAGERFVELLDLGAAGIRKQIEEANNLGAVLDSEVIAKADELNKRFNSIATTIETRMHRGMVLLATDLMDWLDSFKGVEEQSTRQLGDRMAELGKRRLELEQKIGEARASGNNRNAGKVINTANMELKAIAEEEARILEALGKRTDEAGDAANDAAPKVDTLATSLSGVGPATASGVKGISSFADAIRGLKNEIPGLADSLENLDKRAKIQETYKAALANARSIGETYEATRLRDEALSALASKGAREAGSKGMLDLIGYAEGTDKGRGYNETLGFGKFTGGNKNLVTMTLDEVDAMQTAMLRHPDNTFNSSAAGRYQIVQTTLRGLRGKLGLKGTDYFDASMQDRLAQELLRQRGNNPAGLRNEWEGLRRVDDATIRKAYDGTSVSMPSIDPGQAANAAKADEQKKAYADIIAGSQRFTAEQTLEQQALGMTKQAAAALRYEQQMLNEAQQAGITLTPQQRSEIQKLAQGMAEAEQQTLRTAETQQQFAEAQQFMAQQTGNLLTGIITGSMSAEEALQQLLSSLAQAALQAALFGQGPLASFFGGGKGILGGLGLASGGPVKLASGGHVRGPGTGTSDDIPAMLSDGEFVVRSAAAKKHRALLEAINSGGMPRLGFAGGGLASRGMASQTINGGSTTFSPTINVEVAGSTGDPRQDQEYSDKIAKAVSQAFDARASEWSQNQMRPGGVFTRKGLSA